MALNRKVQIGDELNPSPIITPKEEILEGG
jgi:hypothetical protein